MPGGDGGRRTAAGAAGRARRVPGVAGDPAGDRLGVGERAELRHRRLADDHGARLAQPADHLGVGGGRRGVGLPAEGGDGAGDVELLLDRDRYAVQRVPALRRRRAARRGRRPRPGRASASTCENAFRAGSATAIRSRAASTTSRAVNAPLVVSRAVSATPAVRRSAISGEQPSDDPQPDRHPGQVGLLVGADLLERGHGPGDHHAVVVLPGRDPGGRRVVGRGRQRAPGR